MIAEGRGREVGRGKGKGTNRPNDEDGRYKGLGRRMWGDYVGLDIGWMAMCVMRVVRVEYDVRGVMGGTRWRARAGGPGSGRE
jgi:hypothetical protein